MNASQVAASGNAPAIPAQSDSESVYEFAAAASGAPHLPRDFPAWARDVVVVSGRFRAVVTTLVPGFMRVIRYWDQRVRRLVLRDGRVVVVEDSGCYRIE